MGTRSLTYVYDEDREPVLCMYRQLDGYPSGHGAELGEFLNSFDEIVNGYSINENRKIANGMGCLAGQLVSHFKNAHGDFYLYPTKQDQDCNQEYEYHIYHDRVSIKEIGSGFIFTGPWVAFERFCKGLPIDTTPTFDTQAGRQWLLSLLKDSDVTVTFEKNDGTERVMKCTLKEDTIKPNPSGLKARPGRKHNPDVCSVWDIESDGWRSFRFDSIKNVSFSLGE